MPSGKVMWFNSEKGYGFIKQQDGLEIFVRENSIISSGFRTLIEGQEVIFEIDLDTDSRGPQAIKVNVI
jgi:cold shock protein